MNTIDTIFGWACDKIDDVATDEFLKNYYSGDLKEVPETEGDVEKWLDAPDQDKKGAEQVRDLFYRFRDKGFDPARSLWGAMDMFDFLCSPEGEAALALERLNDFLGNDGDGPEENCEECEDTSCPLHPSNR
jgi:hypothetical protein